MATCSELGKAAFANGDYQRAVEIFERCIRDKKNYNTTNMYFGYGDALACSGRVELALDVYTHLSGQLEGTVPLDKLHHLSVALLKSVSNSNSVVENSINNRRSQQPHSAANGAGSVIGAINTDATTTVNRSDVVSELIDPLCCAICKNVLRSPVTAVCGHTFCGECCQSQCCICGAISTTFNSDVLVLRLVEKWWTPEANDKTIVHIQQNALDEALKSCNESLDKCKYRSKNFLPFSRVYTCLFSEQLNDVT